MQLIKKFFAGKTARAVLLAAAAFLLLIAVWQVFFRKSEEGFPATERETKLRMMLEEIEGVERVFVMVGEEDGAPVSAVIVFEGTDGLLLRMRIRDVAAGALLIDRGQVLVCPAS